MAIERKELRDAVRDVVRRGGPMVAVAPTSPVAALLSRIRRIAASRASVLLWGEAGVGKKTLLRALHALSPQHAGPLIRVRTELQPESELLTALFGPDHELAVGQIGSGALRDACGGTLLIEHVEDLPGRAQAWLCDALTTGALVASGPSAALQPPRLVATTSLDPRQAVEDGDLREDLFYMLTVFSAEVPPLRRRRSDVLAWAGCFLRAANQRHGLSVPGFTDDAAQSLARGSWLGNGPELRNAVEHAAVLAVDRPIGTPDLPGVTDSEPSAAPPRVVVPVGTTADDAERRLILATLEHTGFNKAEAARTLALDVKTVRNKLKSYGLM